MKNLTPEKLDKWLNNSLIFLAPLIILYLVTIQDKILSDGITLSDFSIDQKMLGAMMLYLINVALDFFKKIQR